MLTDDLLELQRIDTTADQLTHRRAQLPERTPRREAEARRWPRTAAGAAQAVSRHEELELSIGALERDGEALAPSGPVSRGSCGRSPRHARRRR